MSQDSRCDAPWTEEQVANLERRQENNRLHPYTCECGENLIPTRAGWECEACSYQQSWCHREDADRVVDVIERLQAERNDRQSRLEEKETEVVNQRAEIERLQLALREAAIMTEYETDRTLIHNHCMDAAGESPEAIAAKEPADAVP